VAAIVWHRSEAGELRAARVTMLTGTVVEFDAARAEVLAEEAITQPTAKSAMNMADGGHA
jgi:hypothetical protein